MLFLLSKSEIGRALADRIRGGPKAHSTDPVLLDEVDRLRLEVTELQERMEFAERLLAARKEPDQLESR